MQAGCGKSTLIVFPSVWFPCTTVSPCTFAIVPLAPRRSFSTLFSVERFNVLAFVGWHCCFDALIDGGYDNKLSLFTSEYSHAGYRGFKMYSTGHPYVLWMLHASGFPCLTVFTLFQLLTAGTVVIQAPQHAAPINCARCMWGHVRALPLTMPLRT
jgi:hypothetical protein